MGSKRAREWMEVDESAKEMLARVFSRRPPFLQLPPPLHRVPLRVGNVLEILGPSPSAKTHTLIQAAISCILPEDWNGVHYGGQENVVVFVDLDCRFDILQFSQSLEHRIKMVEAEAANISEKNSVDVNKKELFSMCLRRFFYVRCYNSLQFLATLKTMHKQIKEQRKAPGIGAHVVMIDSIGAFYWMDHASTSLPLADLNRKGLSLQAVSETVVHEIRMLLQLHPMLVIATKTVNLQDRCFKNDLKSGLRKSSSQDTSCVRSSRSNFQNIPYREYMPSVWQNFVTHRVLMRASDQETEHQSSPTFLSEWLLPSLNMTDKFIVGDNGSSCSYIPQEIECGRTDMWLNKRNRDGSPS